MSNVVYRIGVIGASGRGETFARQLYKGTSRATLAGVCDIDEDRLEKFCSYCELEGVRKSTDPHEFIHSPDIDAFIVVVPDFAHADVTVEALHAGKHVYLEKPLANTLDDCYRILQADKETEAVAFVGFNVRSGPLWRKMKEVVESGVLGQIVHISGMEQLAQAHGASFMRRWHRQSARSGGFLNTKCSHDLDLIQWFIGHEHHIVRVASFGGTNVFVPENAPPGHGERCSQCPPDIHDPCPYKDRAGFMFPILADKPTHKTQQADIYGNDLCVYNDDKDIVDNQTIIFEWDNGIRGDFRLEPFQYNGLREMRVWGERGFAELRDRPSHAFRLTLSDTGDTTEYKFIKRKGGHGGTDPTMLGRFVAAIDRGGQPDSSVAEGLAATLIALKADESRLTGKVIEIDPSEYSLPGGIKK